MSLLDEMAASSHQRAQAALLEDDLDGWRRRAMERAPLSLRLDPRFDLITEIKLSSPSEGSLAGEGPRAELIRHQAAAYARIGPAAISVLTEPDRFGGDLADVDAVSAATSLPVMRKDFLVHPVQVWEARAAGASGLLLITRMLPGEALDLMCATAEEAGLFVLLEAFDEVDLAACRRIAAGWSHRVPLLVGVNVRDLSTLAIDPARLARLAPLLPTGVRCVAESGIHTAADAARAASLGYHLALVGTSLMRAPDPSALGQALLQAGRA